MQDCLINVSFFKDNSKLARLLAIARHAARQHAARFLEQPIKSVLLNHLVIFVMYALFTRSNASSLIAIGQ